MSDFWLWFSTGMEHILDLRGYDHILFVSLLVLSYNLKDPGKQLLSITAFTLGHSLSLILSVSGAIHLQQGPVELMIALSILATALYNLLVLKKEQPGRPWIIYGVVCFFGLVHGLGFSYVLRSMLGSGQSTLLPLLYFNLGLESGQLIIVLIVILFSLLLTSLIKCPFRIYKLITVCLIGLVSLKISVERLLDLL